VVVLSDFRAEGWEQPLAQLAARHDVVAVTVDDPRERVFPDAGWWSWRMPRPAAAPCSIPDHHATHDRIRVAAERVLQERVAPPAAGGVIACPRDQRALRGAVAARLRRARGGGCRV